MQTFGWTCGRVRAVLLVATAAAVAVAAALVSAGLPAGSSAASGAGSRRHGGPAAEGVCATVSRLDPQECAAAVRIARSQAAQLSATDVRPRTHDGWPTTVALVTATVRAGVVTGPDPGAACRSGRLLVIEIVGNDYPFAVAPAPGGSDVVTAVQVEADAASGRPCVVSARTGDVRPPPDAVVLYRATRIPVTGNLMLAGGAAPGRSIAVAGYVVVYRAATPFTDPVTRVATTGTGRFAVLLPPGRYSFVAEGSASPGRCSVTYRVTIERDAATITCSIR